MTTSVYTWEIVFAKKELLHFYSSDQLKELATAVDEMRQHENPFRCCPTPFGIQTINFPFADTASNVNEVKPRHWCIYDRNTNFRIVYKLEIGGSPVLDESDLEFLDGNRVLIVVYMGSKHGFEKNKQEIRRFY